MKIEVILSDGVIVAVPARWHGETVSRIAPGQDVRRPGSLWTTKSRIESYLRNLNAVRAELGLESRDVESTVSTTRCAEAPLEIYADTEDGEPWRHFGTLVKEIPYGEAEFGTAGNT